MLAEEIRRRDLGILTMPSYSGESVRSSPDRSTTAPMIPYHDTCTSALIGSTECSTSPASSRRECPGCRRREADQARSSSTSPHCRAVWAETAEPLSAANAVR